MKILQKDELIDILVQLEYDMIAIWSDGRWSELESSSSNTKEAPLCLISKNHYKNLSREEYQNVVAHIEQHTEAPTIISDRLQHLAKINKPSRMATFVLCLPATGVSCVLYYHSTDDPSLFYYAGIVMSWALIGCAIYFFKCLIYRINPYIEPEEFVPNRSLWSHLGMILFSQSEKRKKLRQ